jgi:adenosine deaminase
MQRCDLEEHLASLLRFLANNRIRLNICATSNVMLDTTEHDGDDLLAWLAAM